MKKINNDRQNDGPKHAPKLSPELSEFLHMLKSLEGQMNEKSFAAR